MQSATSAVANPRLVAARHRELARQDVGGQNRRLAVDPALGAMSVQRAKDGRSHRSPDTKQAAGLPSFTLIEEHPWRSVYAMAGNRRSADQTQQPGILLCLL